MQTEQQLLLKKKLCNYLMKNGKKHVCEKVLLKNFKILQKKTKKNHKNLTQISIINNAPIIQLKQIKKKKRKTTKEFPFILNKKNRIALSMKSMLHELNIEKKTKLFNKIPEEILLSSQNKSNNLKSKETNHNNALIKKKYAFFRWFC